MIRAMLIIGGAALIVGLTLYTLLDAVRTPAHEARTLPKWLWVLVTLLFPVVGPLMWLILGRPKAQPAAQQVLLAPDSVSDAAPRRPRSLPPTTMKSTCAGSKQKQNANAAAARQNRTTNRILSVRIPRTARRIRVTGRTSQDS